MKVIDCKRNSHDFNILLRSWCENSFGTGGCNQEWLFDEMTQRFVFWEDSLYMAFLLRWG